jgi:hypothetical protein
MPFLKVGYSENFKDRLYWLNRAMPFEVECLAERSGSLALEKDIHKICVEYLLKNEWYPDLPFVREAFFSVYDRYPGLTQKQLNTAKRREKEEAIMAFGPWRFNISGQAISA